MKFFFSIFLWISLNSYKFILISVRNCYNEWYISKLLNRSKSNYCPQFKMMFNSSENENFILKRDNVFIGLLLTKSTFLSTCLSHTGLSSIRSPPGDDLLCSTVSCLPLSKLWWTFEIVIFFSRTTVKLGTKYTLGWKSFNFFRRRTTPFSK